MPSANKLQSSLAQPSRQPRSLQRYLPPLLAPFPLLPLPASHYTHPKLTRPPHSQILNIKSRTFDTPSDSTAATGKTSTSSGNGIRVQLTAKERERVTQLLKNATSYAEMTRIEKDLNEGRVPAGVGDEMDVEG